MTSRYFFLNPFNLSESVNMSSKTKKVENQEETVNFSFKVVKHVTLPVLQIAENAEVFIKIIDPIFKGKENGELDEDGKPRDPVDLINVINLLTGEPMQIVGGKVLVSTLTENYENGEYVGKCFRVRKEGKKGSGKKSYFPYSILEIELD